MSSGTDTLGLAKHVLDVFQPRTDRRLSDEDARAISHNLVGFFVLLGEWASHEDAETTVRAAGAGGKVDTEQKGGIDKKKTRHRSDGQ